MVAARANWLRAIRAFVATAETSSSQQVCREHQRWGHPHKWFAVARAIVLAAMTSRGRCSVITGADAVGAFDLLGQTPPSQIPAFEIVSAGFIAAFGDSLRVHARERS